MRMIRLTGAMLVVFATAPAIGQTPLRVEAASRGATSEMRESPPRLVPLDQSMPPSPFGRNTEVPLPLFEQPATAATAQLPQVLGGGIPHPGQGIPHPTLAVDEVELAPANPSALTGPALQLQSDVAPESAQQTHEGSSVADPVPAPNAHDYVVKGCPCGKPECPDAVGASAPDVPQAMAPINPAGCNAAPMCVYGDCGSASDDGVQSRLLEMFPCDTCGQSGEPQRLFSGWGPSSNINVYGWLNGGSMVNAASSRFNGPVGFGDASRMQLNQAYSVFEKKVDSRNGFDLGARMDVLWGSDYIFTETTGLERHPNGAARWNSKSDYGVALPQAYLEAGLYDLRVKLGHFYTLIGYESVMAPQNFFYSHAYTMMYGEPFTHTGMLVSYDWNDRWTTHGGIVNGWDRLDGLSDAASFLGGVNYAPDHGVYDIAFSLISGNEADLGGLATTARTMYSVVMNVQLTEQLTYVAQHDHGWQEDFFAAGASAEWYGINQYLFYDLNDCWTIGGRFEWFRDDDGVRVGGVRPGNPYAGNSPGNFFETTVGLNYRPNPNLTIRPELRWDWYDGDGPQPFDANRASNQFMGGFDVILHW